MKKIICLFLFPAVWVILLSSCNKVFTGPSGSEGEPLFDGASATGYNFDVPYNLSMDGQIGTAFFNAYPVLATVFWQINHPELIQFYEIDMNQDGIPDGSNNINAFGTSDLLAPNNYSIKVRSVNYGGNRSVWSVPLNVFYDAVAPNNIATFIPTAHGGGWVGFQWSPSTDSLSGIKYYQLSVIYTDSTPKITSLVLIPVDENGNIPSDALKILVVDPTKSNTPDIIDNENPGWVNLVTTDFTSGMFDVQIKLKTLGNYNFSIMAVDRASNQSAAHTVSAVAIN